MADMMNKVVLFLAVDGLDSSAFMPLWQCFGDMNASTRIASFDADDVIKSSDGTLDTKADMSFNNASTQSFDVIVIPDGKTAEEIKSDADAMAVIKQHFDDNAAIVAVGDGVSVLADAGILSDLEIVAPDMMRDRLTSVGAKMSDKPMMRSNNVFTARKDADFKALCNSVAEFITSLREQAA